MGVGELLEQNELPKFKGNQHVMKGRGDYNFHSRTQAADLSQHQRTLAIRVA